MKTSLLFFLCGFVSNNILGQDWAPFNLHERFNYRNDSSDVIVANYFADSVKVISNDSVFYLDRIVKEIYHSNDTTLALKNQPQFWEREMWIHNNGDYQFKNPGNKVLKTFSQLNDSWLFDSVQNISAIAILFDEENIFGNIDSVKKFLLSNNDTIKLSKHFGLIKFPEENYTSSQLHLTGIEGRNFGELMPSFKTIFDYGIGSSYCYFDEGCGSGSEQPTFHSEHTERMKIFNKEYIGDSIYSYYSAKRTRWDSYQIYFSSIYNLQVVSTPEDTGTKVIYKSDYPFLSHDYCNSIFSLDEAISNSFTGLYIGAAVKLNPDFTRSIYAKTWYYPKYNCIACSDTLIKDNNLIYQFEYEFKEGEGFKSFLVNAFESGCSSSQEYFDSIETNQSCPDGYFYSYDGIEENKPHQIKLMPNPFIDRIIIESNGSNSEIELLNVLGEIVVKQKINSSSTTLDTSELPQGIYFAKIFDGKNVSVQKLIKQ